MRKFRIAMGKDRHKSDRPDPVAFVFHISQGCDPDLVSECYHEALRRFVGRVNRKWVQSLQSQE